MSNLTPYEPYAALADVYSTAGFAQYAEALAPQIMQLAFDQDWMGRAILDLGCGTGEIAIWMAGAGYRVLALDSSQAMLQVAMARAAPMGLSIDWIQGDMRAFKLDTAVDLAICVGGTLNLLPTLNDLESTFRQVSNALEAGKLFFFDLRTIRGLAAAGGDRLVFDNGETAMIITRGTFSYETLSLTTLYHILTHNGLEWRRAEETHLQRGFPVQAIHKLLSKTGFKLLRTMNTALETADPAESDQLLFLAQKQDAP